MSKEVICIHDDMPAVFETLKRLNPVCQEKAIRAVGDMLDTMVSLGHENFGVTLTNEAEYFKESSWRDRVDHDLLLLVIFSMKKKAKHEPFGAFLIDATEGEVAIAQLKDYTTQ